MKRIGVYGGTFDPIHHAHLILAREALEELGLEQIIFVPAAISPHKISATPTPPALRLDMLRAALAGDMHFAIDEMELNRPPPSYAIDTIEELKRRGSSESIFFLIGSDNLPGLDAWHRINELRQLVQFVVLDRGRGASVPSDYPTIRRPIDISATDVRNRIATGRPIRYLVPPAVEEIIRRHQLYEEPIK